MRPVFISGFHSAATAGSPRRILFVSDGPPEPDCVARIGQASAADVDVLYIDTARTTREKTCQRASRRHWTYVRLAVETLRRQGAYRLLIAGQQFVGIYWSWLSRVRPLKTPPLVLLMFIYRSRPGPAGGIYRRFVARALKNPRVRLVVSHSSRENAYYRETFPEARDKMACVPIGRTFGIPPPRAAAAGGAAYFFAGGTSNRDYRTLAAAAGESGARFVVACTPADAEGIAWPPNADIRHDAYGEAFVSLLGGSAAVVLELDDPRISAGQLVLLLAMQMGKPIVATRSAGTEDYLDEECAYLFAPHDAPHLGAILRRILEHPEEAARKGAAARARHQARFTGEAFGRAVGALAAQQINEG